MEKVTANIRSPSVTAHVYRATVGDVGMRFEIGSGLKLEDNVLSVDTAQQVEQDNTKPVTSGAVYMEIGNIEVLLRNL